MSWTIRSAEQRDLPFLEEMLFEAANWRGEQPGRRPRLEDPHVDRYLKGWKRQGDEGVIAVDEHGNPLGAAWFRFFTEKDPGYGFIDSIIPEITIGVAPPKRGEGIGTDLLSALIGTARDVGVPALSLSVEVENPAHRLYQRLGFRSILKEDNALIMRLNVEPGTAIQYPDPALSDGVIRLRPWTEEDIPARVEAFQDPDIIRWTDVPVPYTEQIAREQLRSMENRRLAGRAIFLAILDATSEELLGGVHIYQAHKPSIGEIGYAVFQHARGRGVATRSVRLLANWALQNLGYQRLQIWTFVGNAASQRVAEKVGFKRDRVLRSYADIRGERVDAVMFSLLPNYRQEASLLP